MKDLIKWLRKPRSYTRDGKRAERSMFQWAWNKQNGHWYLSILGMINGPLPRWLRIVLVVQDDKLKLKKKWW